MPPKQQFTKETVVETAYVIARRSGWPTVSARSIAQELSASTQPIYSYMESMAKLEDAVRLRAVLLLAEYQAKPYTDNPYTNMAVGYIAFAREERMLFRMLYLENARPMMPDETKSMNDAIVKHLGKPLPVQTYFGAISADKFNDVALKTWIFTHGLAVALCTGAMNPVDDAEIRRLVEETGGAVVAWQSGGEGKE